MDDKNLWDAFRKTGHIADYLRYRGVDIYAVNNTVKEEENAIDRSDSRPRSDSVDRRSGYS